MAKIIWTDAAITAIDSIASYIGRNSVRYAQLTVEQIFAKTKRLESQPYIGHIVPEINDPTIREIHYKSFRIIYRIDSEIKIYIITVHHFSKSLEDDLFDLT